MVGWLIVAAFATVASQSHESESDDLAHRGQRLHLRHFLTLILSPQHSGIPECYRSTVYIYEEGDGAGKGWLKPLFPTSIDDPADPRVFREGTGAVGTAFEREETVGAVGVAVSSSEYGLSTHQQEHFADCRVVVATPIRLLDGPVVGALAVISEIDDATFVDGDGVKDEGIERLQDTADKVGECLNDLFG